MTILSWKNRFSWKLDWISTDITARGLIKVGDYCTKTFSEIFSTNPNRNSTVISPVHIHTGLLLGWISFQLIIFCNILLSSSDHWATICSITVSSSPLYCLTFSLCISSSKFFFQSHLEPVNTFKSMSLISLTWWKSFNHCFSASPVRIHISALCPICYSSLQTPFIWCLPYPTPTLDCISLYFWLLSSWCPTFNIFLTSSCISWVHLLVFLFFFLNDLQGSFLPVSFVACCNSFWRTSWSPKRHTALFLFSNFHHLILFSVLPLSSSSPTESSSYHYLTLPGYILANPNFSITDVCTRSVLLHPLNVIFASCFLKKIRSPLLFLLF